MNNPVVVIQLDGALRLCPIYWQNFIHYARIKYKDEFDNNDPYILVQTILKEEFNATKVPVRVLDYDFASSTLCFESEEDFIYFKLKFS